MDLTAQVFMWVFNNIQLLTLLAWISELKCSSAAYGRFYCVNKDLKYR